MGVLPAGFRPPTAGRYGIGFSANTQTLGLFGLTITPANGGASAGNISVTVLPPTSQNFTFGTVDGITYSIN
jgi:hypothetical protein